MDNKLSKKLLIFEKAFIKWFFSAVDISEGRVSNQQEYACYDTSNTRKEPWRICRNTIQIQTSWSDRKIQYYISTLTKTSSNSQQVQTKRWEDMTVNTATGMTKQCKGNLTECWTAQVIPLLNTSGKSGAEWEMMVSKRVRSKSFESSNSSAEKQLQEKREVYGIFKPLKSCQALAQTKYYFENSSTFENV